MFGQGFCTENVESMLNMFLNCKSLRYLNLINFNTKHVTDMSGMFQNCTALTKIILGKDFVITENAETTDMFLNCNIKTIVCTKELYNQLKNSVLKDKDVEHKELIIKKI
jgi:surface protein